MTRMHKSEETKN